jgi:hypothetical protein
MEQQEEDAPNGLAGWPDFRKFQLEGVANESAAVPSARSMGGAYEVSQRSLNAGLAASLAIPMISRGARAADTPAEDWSHSID